MAASRGVLVEFVGLPASGKTHLAREVKRALSEAGVGQSGRVDTEITTSTQKRGDDLRVPTLGKMAVTRLLLSPRHCWSSLEAIHRSGQPSWTYVARYQGYLMYVVEELRRARANGEIHLADQGFLQHLWRIQLTGEEEGLERLMELGRRHYSVVEPDIVVFVSVDHRTRMERGIQRGTDVDEELLDPSHPLIQEDMAAYEQLREFVPHLHEALGIGPQIVEIDNTSELLEANVAELGKRVLAACDRDPDILQSRSASSEPQIYREKGWWG